MNYRLVGGRCLKIQFHPIDMNMNIDVKPAFSLSLHQTLLKNYQITGDGMSGRG
jgi:hypothetical protein